MSETVQAELLIDREQFEGPYKPGVTWTGKGDVQTVTAEQWEKMKKHTDVWREVVKEDLTTAGDGYEMKKVQEEAQASAADNDTDPALSEANAKIAATLDDLDNMSDEDVRKFAASLQHTPHHKLKGANLRADVRKALTA